MSTSPKPPERLAEILLEILALSKPTGMSQSESARGTDPGELSDVHCVTEQSQRGEKKTTTAKNRKESLERECA